ncbi:hypothetical protein VK792_18150 [Mesobacterium sp. TK19101]|uniref:Transferrin-binding protein B C-lobe/N-lobe beta barrel domain-containing protein n=1 Tax=Mesobacterium hydrothermale TaxID=3111907 RepID=A0ABU6HL82_9RHOB|nr:hypothetical protein [Mesobacterium sp. TK19101]MEC3863219.1 hypothetical protein [Mesobacterium sp. TK19101]
MQFDFHPRTPLRLIVVTVAAAALSGCIQGNGGTAGGTTGGGTGGTGGTTSASFAAHQSLFSQYTDTTNLSNAPTSDMPPSGNAQYTGSVAFDTMIKSSDSSVVAREVMGDVDMTVQFANSGQSPITGTVDNIRGKDATGADFTWSAQLSTANAAGSGTLTTTESTINAPVVGPVTTRTGAFMVNFTGDIDSTNAPQLGTTGTALVSIGGAMFGSGATHSAGPANLVIDDDQQPGISDFAGTGGTYVVEKR